jgi:hypothetical protein
MCSFLNTTSHQNHLLLCEAFSSAYLDEAVPNKTTIHCLVTKFWDTGRVYDRIHVWHRTVLADVKLFLQVISNK